MKHRLQFNATFMALTAAFSMTLGTAPAEQPGYAGHFILLICILTSTRILSWSSINKICKVKMLQ